MFLTILCHAGRERHNQRGARKMAVKSPSPELMWDGEGAQKPAEAGKEAMVTARRGFPQPSGRKCQDDKLTSQ